MLPKLHILDFSIARDLEGYEFAKTATCCATQVVVVRNAVIPLVFHLELSSCGYPDPWEMRRIYLFDSFGHLFPPLDIDFRSYNLSDAFDE